MKPDKCPVCDSDDIGQLDEGLPLDDEEYEAAGGRYYCVTCGWSEEGEECRGFFFISKGETEWLTLTELQGRLSGTPTKHVLAVWDRGKREGVGDATEKA